MADDLVIVRLVLILVKEGLCAGEGDVVDVLLHLVGGHAKAVIRDGNGLLLGIKDHIDSALEVCRHLLLAHHEELVSLCDGIAAVGDDLSVEDIMIRIQPLLDNRKHVFTVDG